MKSSRNYVESVASGVKIDIKYLKAEINEAVKANVDANIRGTLLLCLPSAETNKALAGYECDCYVRGKETCSGTCLCRSAMKICEVTCNCHGFCCNSLATMPKLDVRDGALGQELYTRVDLPQQKVAFVVCGQILTEALFQSIGLINPLRSYYGVRVSWPGYSKDVPGDPGEVKFVVDPSTHISGKANHSCDPNIAVSPCWSNSKVYAVGKTLRRIISHEALTFDYKWNGVNDGPAAELCFCRSSRCRGFIADPSSRFMERSIEHYEKELVRLVNFHEDAEKYLLHQIESLDSEVKKILNVNQQLGLARRLEKNDKLRVTCDNMEAAILKAKDAMTVARHAKCMERKKKYERQLRDLDCKGGRHRKIKMPEVPHPSPVFSTSGETKVSCCGWLAEKDLDEPICPLPLSLALACGGSLRYFSGAKPPWVPSGSCSRSTSNLRICVPSSLPSSQLPTPRTVRPTYPALRPLGRLPEEVSQWPEGGFMSLDERKKVMAWIEGRISARDRSRSVYPPEIAITFAYWLHTRVRKPNAKNMRTFRTRWSGITTQDLIDRYEEEAGEIGSGPSWRVVHCILADLLTYTPFKYNSDVKLVEDKADGNRWPFAWMGLLTLPGVVPDFSADRNCGSHRSC